MPSWCSSSSYCLFGLVWRGRTMCRPSVVGRCTSTVWIVCRPLRRLGARGTELARAQCGTLRLKLLKIAAHVYISTRRVRLAFSETSPWSAVFVQVLENLQRQPLWNDTG